MGMPLPARKRIFPAVLAFRPALALASLALPVSDRVADEEE
jgi:hypothetical protein